VWLDFRVNRYDASTLFAMKAFVTGGAGFIGSNLVDRLLSAGHEVTAYDNLSTGQPQFLEGARAKERFQFVQADILDAERLTSAMAGHDIVFHLSANADVRFGTQHPRKDLDQNTIGTWHVLEAMRANAIRRIAFSSTGSVYGEAVVVPTPEDAPFPVQTSLYGASKLAGEALIAAYCEGYQMQSWIFRFVSILGERYTHGHVFDFYKQLLAHPDRLDVLGDGHQKKSYLNIRDCVDAILLAVERAEGRVNILNLGTDEYVEVNDSIDVLVEALQLAPKRSYSGGERGWIGDNPLILLDCKRMRALGWKPRYSIRDSLRMTLDWLRSNDWVLTNRN
jgi:UDP-glucose 4-epimerase